MQILLYILLALIAIGLGTVSYFFYQHNNRLFTTLQAIDENTGGLTTTLQHHQEAVKAMPDSFNEVIAKELNQGLHATVNSVSSVQKELDTTHQNLQHLFRNIPHLDQMPVWLSEVKDVITPLRTAVGGLQTLDDKVIERFNTFMAGRDQMEKTFTEVSEVILTWTENSKNKQADFHQMVNNHFSNLNEQTKDMEEALGTLEQFVSNSQSLMNGIRTEFPSAVRELGELTQKTNHLISTTEQNTERVGKLLEKWEERTKNQQWQIYLGYGLMTANLILLFVIILKLV